MKNKTKKISARLTPKAVLRMLSYIKIAARDDMRAGNSDLYKAIVAVEAIVRQTFYDPRELMKNPDYMQVKKSFDLYQSLQLT